MDDQKYYLFLCKRYKESPVKGEGFGKVDPYSDHAKALEKRHRVELKSL
jgi:hypothetical protein